MSLRQLCKETTKQPSKALLYFPQEMTTGIAPTRLILDKSSQYKEGSTVTVNWEGKKIQAEIVAVDGKSNNISIVDCLLNIRRFCSVIFVSILSTLCLVFSFHIYCCANLPLLSLVTDSEEVLNQKDVEWSSKFLPTAEPAESSPSSNQSNLPAEKKKTRQQPRKTQVNSSVHKVLIVHLHLRGDEAGLISIKSFFRLCPLSNKQT